TAGADGTVRVWPAAGGKEELVLWDPGHPPHRVAWAPDASLLAAGNQDGTITIWDAKGKRLGTHDGPAPWSAHVLAFTPDGTGLPVAAVGWAPDGRTIAWGHLRKPWDAEAEYALERTFDTAALRAGPAPEEPATFGRAVRTRKGRTVTAFVQQVRVFEGDEDI